MPVSVTIDWPQPALRIPELTPVRFGIGVPEGMIWEPSHCQIELPQGISLIGQAAPLGHWHDGTIRWMLVDCIVPQEIELIGPWRVSWPAQNSAADLPVTVHPVKIDHACGQTVVDNGIFAIRFNCQTGGFQIDQDGVPLAKGELPELIDLRGTPHQAIPTQVRVTSAGPLRGTLEIDGVFPGLPALRTWESWSIYAGSPHIQVDVTLHNRRPAKHRGGLWDLGDPGSTLFREFSQAVFLIGDVESTVSYRCEAEHDWTPARSSFAIYQDSSGGVHWDSRNHINRLGKIPLRFRGYRAQIDKEPLLGMRAQPAVQISSGQWSIGVELVDFWQQFPKQMSADLTALRIGFFPQEFGDLHELQGGEQKTHRYWLSIHRPWKESLRPDGPSRGRQSDSAPRKILARSLAPDVIPGLPNWRDADRPTLARLDSLAEDFLAGPEGLYANREHIDEYGWRNYGEVYADHENQYYKGVTPLVSHYNNQFDILGGFLLLYLRLGDVRWMDFADALARHVIDIDVYHTTGDRPAYNGGLFWFTDHYLHAETSTHRTYSKKNQPPSQDYGGGPSAGHNFTTGLLLYHLLTGDRQARDTMLELCEWVLAQDDGERTIWGLLDSGPTGLASASSSGIYHGPSRTGGNSINALLDGWLLTRDRRFLEYAERLIHRCVHPNQDIDGLDLLDFEKSWSYTVFLVSLDKYIRCQELQGELDDNYAYARASLLRYAEWMLENERPYFDWPSKMEYPTEAWAAQEFRKANVLRLAARYADNSLRVRMLDRGDALADRAWSDLLRFKTRTSARAMAVLLTEGVRDAELRSRTSPSPPIAPPLGRLREHQPFMSQRERIRRGLRCPRAAVRILLSALNPLRWPHILNHR